MGPSNEGPFLFTFLHLERKNIPKGIFLDLFLNLYSNRYMLAKTEYIEMMIECLTFKGVPYLDNVNVPNERGIYAAISYMGDGFKILDIDFVVKPNLGEAIRLDSRKNKWKSECNGELYIAYYVMDHASDKDIETVKEFIKAKNL